MITVKLSSAMAAVFFFAATPASSLELASEELQELQKNIDVFSTVLEEALDLDQSTSVFGMSAGGVESTYLYGQGVVLEVRTPLSNRRNRLKMASFSSVMQSLSLRPNPFERMSRPTAPDRLAGALALSFNAEEADDFYAEMMDRVANIDYSRIVSDAIRQASDAARSLRSIGGVDDTAYRQLRTEIDALREEMQENLAQMRQVERGFQQSLQQDGDDREVEALAEMRAALDKVRIQIEPLRERALAKAADLRQRSELAEQEYAARWQEDVAEFESSLYAAMCDYGVILRVLPDNENISIVLSGLGVETEDGRRTDKLHVFSKMDVQDCQAGDIDLAALREKTVQYSY